MARRVSKKQKKESVLVRYSFYVALFAMIAATVAAIDLYGAGQLSLTDAEVYSSVTLSFIFPLLVFSYLLAKGMTLRQVISNVGLSRDKLSGKMLFIGFVLFLIILLTEIILGLVSQLSGVQLPTNVSQVLAGTPLWFILFGAFISPINEEILFRGFLVPRIGVIFSALIFAVLHSGYASISEFVGVLVFGLLAGYVFKRTGSLYATIAGHMLVNLLTVALFLTLGASGM